MGGQDGWDHGRGASESESVGVGMETRKRILHLVYVCMFAGVVDRIATVYFWPFAICGNQLIDNQKKVFLIFTFCGNWLYNSRVREGFCALLD